MRGGTSKGVFFSLDDLPLEAQLPGQYRDRLMLRVIGSPDPYGQHIDGMGGGVSSNSKVVILSKSTQPNHDVDYLFGQPAIDKPVVDWSGNCGNLTAAAAARAVTMGLLGREHLPDTGVAEVRIWQANISKTIVAHVPVKNGQVQESGDFELDGVAFPAAEIKIDFIDPADRLTGVFPTGKRIEALEVAGVGTLEVTMTSPGIPMVFLSAANLGYAGTELQPDINADHDALERFEKIRIAASVKMGLSKGTAEASAKLHIPKIAFCAPPAAYLSANGKTIGASDADINIRALSMGRLHHAMMGTGAIAIACAAAVPGTLVNLAAGGGKRSTVTFGHPSGRLTVGADVVEDNGIWSVTKASLSRSARVLMEGWVNVPANVI